jgi:flagellar basal-body rod protein FlgB
MSISELPILSMLKTKMHWHQERQRLLAQNVSNADTPQFRPTDLAPPTFDKRMTGGASAVALARTDAGHLVGSQASGSGHFRPDASGAYEVRPAGNAVSLEDEMMKVAGNQMDYQAATALYGRSLGLIKAALGKR